MYLQIWYVICKVLTTDVLFNLIFNKKSFTNGNVDKTTEPYSET